MSDEKRKYSFIYNPKTFKEIPCQSACPVNTDIRLYVQLVAEGRYKEAHRVIRETNPFPSVCGRVCQHFCEKACNRNMIDKAVSICTVKRAATDYSWDDMPLPDRSYPTLEKIAVIGAGPAGLTAAYDLALLGYRVTVFEAMPHGGGMLRYGIPAYRLPREEIDREIEFIKRAGVDIKFNTKIGKDILLNDLKSEYKAVIIAAGAHEAVKMNVPGEDLENVMGGATFMRKINLGEKMDLVGKRVAVIGGGFTAMDCSRSAIRLGASEVTVVYRRTKDEIPVHQKELTEAEEEGVKFRYLETPVECVTSDGHKVSGLKIIKNKLGEPDKSGRRKPVPIEGSEFVIELDVVVAAVSQAPDMSVITKTGGFELTTWGTLRVDNSTFKTNIPGIWVCGDFIAGTRDVINVIADGHKTAISVDMFLRGLTNDQIEPALKPDVAPAEFEEKPGDYDLIPRQTMRVIPLYKRKTSWEEVERGLSKESARLEAMRCLQCNNSWAHAADDCILCGNCVDVCPQSCLTMRPLTEIEHNRLYNEGIRLSEQGIHPIKIDRDQCVRCTFCEQVCPTHAIDFKCYSRSKA